MMDGLTMREEAGDVVGFFESLVSFFPLPLLVHFSISFHFIFLHCDESPSILPLLPPFHRIRPSFPRLRAGIILHRKVQGFCGKRGGLWFFFLSFLGMAWH